jgi:hypothetical protein
MSIDPSFWQGAKRAPRTVRQRAPGGRESRAFHMPRPERHPNSIIDALAKRFEREIMGRRSERTPGEASAEFRSAPPDFSGEWAI